MLCILTHQGLGDHIICNGLIRSLLDNNDSIVLFIKQNNFFSVQKMYKDESRIFCMPFSEDNEEACFDLVARNNSKLKIGFYEYFKSLQENKDSLEKKFDFNFYKIANVPFENRWKRFFLLRDLEEEESTFKKLEGDKEPYIFVHEDPSRNFFLNPYNPNNYRVIKNNKNYSIFSMIKILEEAKEIHCMESSFNVLIEHLFKIDDKRLFYYPNVRKYPDYLLATTKRKWNIVLN